MGWLWSSTPSKPEPDAKHETTQPPPPPPLPAIATPRPPHVGTLPQSRVDDPTDPTSSRFALTEEQRIRIFGRPSVEKSDTTPAQGKEADAEVEAFLNSLAAPAPPTPAQPAAVSKPSPSSPTAAAADEPDEPLTIDRRRPDGSLDISLDVMHPRTMSCVEAFDELLYCQNAWSKVNNVYQHGQWRSCSEEWAAWKFCMRVRMLAEKDKQPQIRDYYANRLAERKKQFGSSEDVWEARDTAVEKAFWKHHDES
jgi:hypothetical protein